MRRPPHAPDAFFRGAHIAIMATRSYPTDDFDQRADDMSAEHPDVVEHCRRAHQVAVAHERGDADTEQLRQAAISYRSLVQALLGDHAHPDHGQGDQARGDRRPVRPVVKGTPI